MHWKFTGIKWMLCYPVPTRMKRTTKKFALTCGGQLWSKWADTLLCPRWHLHSCLAFMAHKWSPASVWWETSWTPRLLAWTQRLMQPSRLSNTVWKPRKPQRMQCLAERTCCMTLSIQYSARTWEAPSRDTRKSKSRGGRSWRRRRHSWNCIEQQLHQRLHRQESPKQQRRWQGLPMPESRQRSWASWQKPTRTKGTTAEVSPTREKHTFTMAA